MNANRSVLNANPNPKKFSVLNANFFKEKHKNSQKTAFITVNGTVRAVITSNDERTVLCMKHSNSSGLKMLVS